MAPTFAAQARCPTSRTQASAVMPPCQPPSGAPPHGRPPARPARHRAVQTATGDGRDVRSARRREPQGTSASSALPKRSSSTSERTSSLRISRERWTLTVASRLSRQSAICLLSLPSSTEGENGALARGEPPQQRARLRSAGFPRPPAAGHLDGGRQRPREAGRGERRGQEVDSAVLHRLDGRGDVAGAEMPTTGIRGAESAPTAGHRARCCPQGRNPAPGIADAAGGRTP